MATHPNGSRFFYGLGAGTSDSIGFQEITITPEMAGKRVAVFTAIEFKRPDGKGRASALQKKFLSMVRSLGGIAGIALSPEEAQGIINEYHRQLQEPLERDHPSINPDKPGPIN